MTFLKHLARINLSTLLSLSLLGALSACVQAPQVLAPAGHCSDLPPESWHTKGVEGAELPVEDKVGQWMAYGIAEAGQLDKANAQTRDQHEIIAKCEARDAAVIKSFQPKPWWKIW